MTNFMRYAILVLVILFFSGCYLNPLFRSIAGLEKKSIDNTDTLLAFLGVALTNQTSTSATNSSDNSNPSPENPSSIPVETPPAGTPPTISYSSSSYSFFQNSAILALTPTITGTVLNCTASPSLPAGLNLNNTSCAITGTPTVLQASASYTITVENSDGSNNATISIEIIVSGNQIAFIKTDSSQPNLFEVMKVNPDGTGLTTIRSTNTAGYTTWTLRWSPDRTKIAMYGANGANYEARVMNADGSGLFVVKSVPTASVCAVGYGSPVNWWDNSTLIHNVNTSPNCHINKINTDGTGDVAFISYGGFGGQAVFSPERSPDGTKVLLMNWGTGNTMHYLYTVNQDGSTGITSLGINTYNADPRYSPDQSKISYNDWPGTWRPDYANSNGTGVTVVTAFFSTAHAWYDNNSWIYFDNSVKELRRRNLDGTGMITILTLGPTEIASDIHY